MFIKVAEHRFSRAPLLMQFSARTWIVKNKHAQPICTRKLIGRVLEVMNKYNIRNIVEN